MKAMGDKADGLQGDKADGAQGVIEGLQGLILSQQPGSANATNQVAS